MSAVIPEMGIIMLDTVFPRIPGDIGNPDSFAFPVVYHKIKGATVERVVKEADPSLLAPFVDAARELEGQGVKLISTSCGFLAMFQQQLNEAVAIPVLSSSLLQIHAARAIIKPGQRVAVVTARAASLSARHFAGVGVDPKDLVIVGMESAAEFTAVFIEGKNTLDEPQCRREMVETVRAMLAEHDDIGAIVLECTNMPPYSQAIREETGLPVFDVVTMLNYARGSLTA